MVEHRGATVTIVAVVGVGQEGEGSGLLISVYPNSHSSHRVKGKSIVHRFVIVFTFATCLVIRFILIS